MIVLSLYWYTISRRLNKPYKGHFISIVLLAVFSLIIQMYFSVYASFKYINIDPFYDLALASSLRLPAGINYWIIPFFGFFLLEAVFLGFIGIDHSRRITPEIILSFFLSFMGFVLFPNHSSFFSIVAGWFIWCFASPLLSNLLSRKDKRLNIAILNKSIKVFPALLLISSICIIILTVLSSLGNMDIEKDILLQQFKVFSASGGQNGLGLYNGHFRNIAAQNRTHFIIGVLFEEMGFRTGTLFIILLMLTAYGCYFQGVRAEKYPQAILCFLAAAYFGLHTMISLASATGFSVNIMGLRFDMPVINLPTPFLSSGVSCLVLFICLAMVEAVKLTRSN